MATNADFYHAAQERLGDRIDTYAGDWTDWWADGLGSAARVGRLNRRAQAAVRSAQTAARHRPTAWPHRHRGRGGGDRRGLRDLALFDEHTWGAAEPWEDRLEGWWSGPRQWQTKSGYAIRAMERSDELIESGMERLVAQVASRHGAGAVIVVVNPTMYPRTDIVRTFVQASQFLPAQGFGVIDLERGERVPSVAGVPDRDRDRRRSRGRDLALLAADVPPFGYRVFGLVDEPEEAGPADAQRDAAGDNVITMGNEFYELSYDLAEGCIASIVDRRTGRALVAADSIFGFGQYVYDRYSTAPRFNHLSSKIEAFQLELLGERAVARHAALIERSSTVLAERLTVRLAAPGTNWLDVTVTLPRGIDRVDLEYRLSKPDEEEKESAYLAFPFQVARSGLRAEITGGVYEPDAPRVPGSA